MTKREGIMQAITALMKTVAEVAPSSVYRARTYPLAANRFPAISVEFVSDIVVGERLTDPIKDWNLTVRIGTFGQGDSPETECDPVTQAVYNKMVQDLSLGGLTMDIQPVGVKNELYDAAKPIGVQFQDFRVLYRTTSLDLSS